jgi:hypothetical protein
LFPLRKAGRIIRVLCHESFGVCVYAVQLIVALTVVPPCVKVTQKYWKNFQIHDNTKPSARMGRKAYWVSLRQPGRRNIALILGARLFFAQSPPEDQDRFPVGIK